MLQNLPCSTRFAMLHHAIARIAEYQESRNAGWPPLQNSPRSLAIHQGASTVTIGTSTQMRPFDRL